MKLAVLSAGIASRDTAEALRSQPEFRKATLNMALASAAIDAMKRAKFTPARQNGTPLKVWITRTINFKLK